MCSAPNPNPEDGGVRRPRPTVEPPPDRDHLHRLHNVWVDNPIYFLTCCTAARRPILTQPAAAEILLATWQDADRVHGWVVGRHVIMPDHVHCFARPRPDAKPLSAFVRDWKRWTAKQICDATGTPPPVWQLEFFDHVLRSPRSYAEKWDYVRANPVRAGLAATPDSWPHAGEGADLTW
ncbi:MAG: transposase [Verrucomicrobia bacterium]|nr:transposase [Verrucomicrobiota bacterium]